MSLAAAAPTTALSVHRTLEDEQKSIQEQEQQLAQQKADLNTRIETAANEERRKLETELVETQKSAQELRELSRQATDPEVALKFLRAAETAEKEVSQILSKLGRAAEVTVNIEQSDEDEPKRLSTNKGIFGFIVLLVLSAVLFYMIGTSLVTNEENDSAVRMMNSVGLRLISNPLPAILAILFSVGSMRLLFPEQFFYWNNRAKTSLSLVQDLKNSQPCVRIAFFCFCFYVLQDLFVKVLQVIFG